MRQKSRCEQAFDWMTPDQAMRYQRLNTEWEQYSEAGVTGRGGKYQTRDFDFEADVLGAIHNLCCEVWGEEPYPSKPLPPEMLVEEVE